MNANSTDAPAAKTNKGVGPAAASVASPLSTSKRLFLRRPPPVTNTQTSATSHASPSVTTEMKAVSFVANSIAADADASMRYLAAPDS